MAANGLGTSEVDVSSALRVDVLFWGASSEDVLVELYRVCGGWRMRFDRETESGVTGGW